MSRLVLSRREGQKIIINSGSDDIIVSVVNINKSFVRLSFDSPRHVEINREEIAKEKGII